MLTYHASPPRARMTFLVVRSQADCQRVADELQLSPAVRLKLLTHLRGATAHRAPLGTGVGEMTQPAKGCHVQ